MELRCPDCCGPEVLPDPRKSPGARGCGNCNALFHRDSALVTVADAESNLEQDRGEDPIAYTLRIMAETLGKANGLAARFGQAERRLDRIAEWMNEGRWDSVYFIERVEAEPRASGRHIRNTDE